jgi:hypothetical protein
MGSLCCILETTMPQAAGSLSLKPQTSMLKMRGAIPPIPHTQYDKEECMERKG